MGLWLGNSPLILASQSSARKMLLANAGLEFEAVTADIDERGIQTGSKLSDPREIALLLAREKAKAVSANRPGSYVIGADQTLALGERLFNKPAGRVQAMAQLRDLAGNCHQLNSAVAVAHDGKIVFELHERRRSAVAAQTDRRAQRAVLRGARSASRAASQHLVR